jgi:hypothetical protein
MLAHSSNNFVLMLLEVSRLIPDVDLLSVVAAVQLHQLLLILQDRWLDMDLYLPMLLALRTRRVSCSTVCTHRSSLRSRDEGIWPSCQCWHLDWRRQASVYQTKSNPFHSVLLSCALALQLSVTYIFLATSRLRCTIRTASMSRETIHSGKVPLQWCRLAFTDRFVISELAPSQYQLIKTLFSICQSLSWQRAGN